jgi:ribonuclease M5
MLKIKEAIVVEGRYDKNTLSQLVDTLIIQTDGFGIFKNKEKAAMLRQVAEKRGLIVLTDSDGAGFLIRSHLKGIVPPEQVKHAYIPDLYGKEKRKRTPGKEGKLGVEGMRPEVLEQALRQCGATIFGENAAEEVQRRKITKLDLYQDGFSGGAGSAARRQKLLKRLNLPEHLTAKALPEVLTTLLTYEEYRKVVEEIDNVERSTTDEC